MAENIQQQIMEFEKNRNQLLGISAQKQQLQVQSQTLKITLEELDKTTEKQVYKATGNILILADTDKVKKETKEKMESADLRLKTIVKQEESLVNKLNKLRSEIETAQKELMGNQVIQADDGEKKAKK
ncbi:MAG: prefoldin subunit beta [Candidatus Diapherotrites archaeon]|uniref:Prefoldin subunit beta n=1 Tax=Candidatus Iainarchaeum sp. TaxID=3101447 RepID=A0A2D6M1H6_9ARCH|nr:prefoldin subunit beta [Candidatus Diapherotrites archaeon]|tara:strand:+ start:8036 stop:8419 length:384 start_codon:yes stop_codon:yes gene_type:complete